MPEVNRYLLKPAIQNILRQGLIGWSDVFLPILLLLQWFAHLMKVLILLQ